GTYTYTPNQDYVGNDTVVVTICDDGTPLPALCTTDTIFIEVTPVNDAPSQGNETLTGVQEDAVNPTTSVDLTGNNIDPDGTTVTVTTIVSTTGGGTVVDNGDGTVDYTPASNFNGVDTVIYTVCDAGTPMPAQCVNDTLFVTVDPVNDAPSQGNETLTVNEDDPATTSVDLTGNNIDPDGTTTTVTTIVSSTGGGTVVDNGDGTVDYTPASNFNGVDTVIYTVCDAGTPMPAQCVNDTLFVTVNPVNDPPVVDNEIIFVPINGSTGGDLTDIGDSDIDGNLVVTTTPLTGPSNGSIVINPDGTYTYTPNPGYTGNDTVVVTICDDGTPLPALCTTDTIFITVTPTNPPVATDNNDNTLEDTPVTFNVSNDDTDSDGTIDGSTVDLDPGTPGIQNTFTSPDGVWTVDSNGNVTFTPNQDYNGTATINYTVNDNDGATSNTAVLTVIVTPVNDPPVVDNETHTTPEDTPVSGDLTGAGDSDVDGNLVVTTTPLTGPNNGSIVINSDGTYTYTPNQDYIGNDTVVVTICDDGTPLPALCTTDTIFIEVTPVNDAPSQGNETLTVNEDGPTTTSVDLTGNNIDPDGTATTVTTIVSTTGGGNVADNGDGTVDYTPAPNFNGVDTVIYTVCDAGTPMPAQCVNDTLFVTVDP
ncbi:tandem-95 repeat protein, partial [Pseudophaeobacter sp.]|uniref:tandem-95 repeat protein n=1 Tax=Pseudophaeobacter sp. TaxID=1971739 RepID=UPI0040595C89